MSPTDPDPYGDPFADAGPTPTSADDAYPTAPQPPAVQYARPMPTGDLQHAGFSCPYCGYDLTGAVIGGHCPECGSHINPQSLTSAANNGLAVTSMVMGILALALCWMYAIPLITLAPMGIIFGHIARSQMRSGRYSQSSEAFAKTGLICSYIGLGLFVVPVLIGILLATL